MRTRAGMERSVFQERGDGDLDHWWWWACSANWVVSEENEVKGDPQFPRLGNAWQDVPATGAVNMKRAGAFPWDMVNVMLLHLRGQGSRPQICKAGTSLLETLKTRVKTLLLPPDCGAGPSFLWYPSQGQAFRY